MGLDVKSSEQERSAKSRPYTMRRRAEQVDQTRERITEAAVRLHTTVGPAHASIAAVAEQAGVTRLTVYRHFSDLDALFAACRAHWFAQNTPPDPGAWGAIPGLEARAQLAFGELYGWYRAHADELYPINRDVAAMPLSAQRATAVGTRRMAEALVAGHASAGSDGSGRLLRAIAGHLMGFMTWRSFAIEQGLTDGEAVNVAVRIVAAVELDGPNAG